MLQVIVTIRDACTCLSDALIYLPDIVAEGVQIPPLLCRHACGSAPRDPLLRLRSAGLR